MTNLSNSNDEQEGVGCTLAIIAGLVCFLMFFAIVQVLTDSGQNKRLDALEQKVEIFNKE